MLKYTKLGVLVLTLVLLFGCTGGDTNTNTNGNATVPGTQEQTQNNQNTGNQEIDANAIEYCTPGASWGWTGEEGTVSTVILGMEEYKGETYCHAKTEASGQGEQATIDYYFQEENGETVDLWIIMSDETGILSEQHVTGSTGSTTGNTGDVAQSEWCPAGSSFSMNGDDMDSSMIIEGIVEYKGKPYCHVEFSGEVEGQTTYMEYYYMEVDGEIVDMWMLVYDSNGQLIQEQNIIVPTN